jgi:hypothetical protein
MKKPIKKLKVLKRKVVPTADAGKLTKTKARYRFKEGFADDLKKRSMESYRKGRGKSFELTGATVLRQADSIDDFAVTIAATNILTEKTAPMPVIRQQVLAEILNTSYQTIWRWSSETGQLPEPALIDNTEGRGRGVYHVNEVRVIVAVIGEHLRAYKYYRKDHTGTRDKLFAQIEAVRKSNYKD